MEEVFGKTMCETWYHLVDAVMAGEDTFSCPDQHTYGWVMGQFPKRCFPVLDELIGTFGNPEQQVVDGTARFTYLVPQEEAAARITKFAGQIEGILNEAFEPDDSDFEKAFKLYRYFYEHYQYDYDTEKKMYEEYVDYLSPCRLLNTGIGICSEISPMYSYLLMQTGTEATTMMGGAHEWSYVRIGGKNYHIDPTFVLASEGSLSYLLMTDDQRDSDGFSRKEYIICSNYAQDHPHPDYIADDDTFSAIWDYNFDQIIPDQQILRCWQYTEGWEKDYFDFDYSGY